MQKLSFVRSIADNFILKCALGILLIFAAAQIVIPIKPVHVTLHTLAAMLIGLTYKPKEAATTFASFIALGLIGLPIFSNFSSGFAYFAGPVGGYYVGMFLAATIMAYFKAEFEIGTLFNCLFGQLIIYIPGILWLSGFIGMESAIFKGFFVFVPSGIVKLFLLVSLFRALEK